MLLYNIRKAKYAASLLASGVANRWNRNNEYVIYAGSSRALCALEMVVHRAAIQPGTDYRLMIINAEVEDHDITTLGLSELPSNWQSLQEYPNLQKIGSTWYQSEKTLLLKVPSVIIPQEFNYIIHTKHPDFKKKIKIASIESFTWDRRLL